VERGRQWAAVGHRERQPSQAERDHRRHTVHAGQRGPGAVERVAEWVRSRFPVADAEPHLVETCIYTNTADEHFVLERHGPGLLPHVGARRPPERREGG
jgi:hypothetical protein